MSYYFICKWNDQAESCACVTARNKEGVIKKISKVFNLQDITDVWTEFDRVSKKWMNKQSIQEFLSVLS